MGCRPCARDHRALALSCSHLGTRYCKRCFSITEFGCLRTHKWVKARSRETHSLSRSQDLPITHIHAIVIATVAVQNTQHCNYHSHNEYFEIWYVTNQPPKANSAIHPSGVGKWVPASAGKEKAGMVHSVSGWTRGMQVKLWDPLRMRAISKRLRGVFTMRRYTNSRLPYLTHCEVALCV